jgi:hypothetical protein
VSCARAKRCNYRKSCAGNVLGSVTPKLQSRKSHRTETLQPRIVGRLCSETLITSVMDEDTTPFLFNDVNRLWSKLRYGCLKDDEPHVVDCLTCEEQLETVAEYPDPDRVIIEWCCGHDSLLGCPSKYSKGCKVVRLTIDDDLRMLDFAKRWKSPNNVQKTEPCYGAQCRALEGALCRGWT